MRPITSKQSFVLMGFRSDGTIYTVDITFLGANKNTALYWIP